MTPLTSNPTIESGVTTVLGDVWTWLGTTIDTANSHPVMWVPVGFGIAGACIGLLRRATRVGGRRR